MRLQKQLLAFSTFLMTLFGVLNGCTDTIDFDFGEPKPTVVLNSLLNTDSVPYARLTWLNHPGAVSYGSLFWSFAEINDAEVSLYENGTFIEQLTPVIMGDTTYLSNLYYKGSHALRQGQTYRLVATLPGGQSVAAQGTTPAPPSFTVGNATRVHSSSDPGKQEIQIPLRLDDPAGERNFYRIRLIAQRPSKWSRDITWIGPGKQESNYLFANEFRPQIFIDDELFDGQSVELIIRCENLNGSDRLLEITALTEESYRYLSSKAYAQERGDDFLTEPIPVLSNITDGVGFVGGVAVREQPVNEQSDGTD